MLAEKAKKLRANAKAQRQQEKRAQEEKAAPIISEIRKFWNRFGEARNAADKTVKECYKALNMYWAHTDDEKVINLECLEAKFNTNTPLPYGYSFYLSDAQRLVGIADLLGCSLDYLFCRTADPNGARLRRLRPRDGCRCSISPVRTANQGWQPGRGFVQP